MVVSLLLFCLYLPMLFAMEKPAIPSIEEKIDTHYNGHVYNLPDIYRDIPFLIEHANKNNRKALLVLISYTILPKLYFDYSTYTTPQTTARVAKIPWQLLPLGFLTQEEPTSTEENFYWGVFYYNKLFEQFHNNPNLRRGLKLIKKSADAGFCKAKHCIGCLYTLPKQRNYAFQTHKEAAHQDYIPSIFELGRKYLHAQDIDRGLDLIKEAALKNYSSAHYYLGLLYDQKIPLLEQPNYKEAKRHYEAAADLGCLQATRNLGLLYIHAKGVEKDIIYGLHLINQLANHEYAPAQVYIGSRYVKGDLIQQDMQKGISLLKKATEQHNAKAEYELAIMSLTGNDYLQQDHDQAIRLLVNASRLKNKRAQWQLGVMRINGIIVKKNALEGVVLLHNSAKQCYSKAQFTLGLMYYYGELIKKDSRQGLELIRKAAQKNYEPACEFLVVSARK